jgi:hypothetical protein
MRTVILCVAMIALGAAGGYLAAASRTQPQPAATIAPVAPIGHDRAGSPVVVAGGLSEADLRRVVKEELAAGRTDRDEAPAAPAQPAPHADNPAAYDDGMRRVNQALAQRAWTPDDASALGRTLDTMSQEQRDAIFHKLIPALNRGEIKLTYRGALF